MYSGSVENCNFTGNNATTGSAIYFYSTSTTKTISNSRFLNNRANAEALEVTKNDNNITITFTGRTWYESFERNLGWTNLGEILGQHKTQKAEELGKNLLGRINE